MSFGHSNTILDVSSLYPFSLCFWVSLFHTAPPLITLAGLTSWGHSLGSFQHVDPFPSLLLVNDHPGDEVDDADDDDDIHDDAQLRKISSWNMWSAGARADNETSEWLRGVEWF